MTKKVLYENQNLAFTKSLIIYPYYPNLISDSVVTKVNIRTAAKFAVVLSWSNRGDTSAMSKLISFPVLKMSFMNSITTSGSSPSGCGALTPGANEVENTSEHIVAQI